MSSADVLVVVIGTLAFTAIGSFTCVVIDRLPLHLDEPNQYGELWDTNKWAHVLGGTSRCSSCGAPVRPYDNIPIVSWLVLRGRCRACEAAIPAFHPMVELLCPLLYLGAVWALGVDWMLVPALWLIPVGVAVSAIDLRTLIVPTRIVWPATAVLVVMSGAVAVATSEPKLLLGALVGVLALAGPLFAIWFLVPSGMGFGDVRLAVLLGWSIGFYAGGEAMASVIMALICLALASVVGLAVGLIALGARGAKAKVPFGPALVVAAYFCVAFAPQILDPFGVYGLA